MTLRNFTLAPVLIFIGMLTAGTLVQADGITEEIDLEKCFKYYAENDSMTYKGPRCLNALRGLSQSIPLSPGTHYNALKNPSEASANASAIEEISKKAADVYYDDAFCGPSPSHDVGAAWCTNFRELAQLHPDRLHHYKYNCAVRMPNHGKCSTLSKEIARELGYCDETNARKNFCNKIIRDFLMSPKCSPTSTEADCRQWVIAQKGGDNCGGEDIRSYHANDCTGRNNDVAAARVTPEPPEEPEEPGDAEPIDPAPAPPSPSPNPPPGDITDGGGDGSGGDGSGGGNDLGDLADRVADNVFGNGQGGMGGQQNRQKISGNSNVPEIDVQSSLSASGNYQPAGGQGSQYQGGATEPLPVTAKFPMGSRGEPGGQPRNPQQPGGGAQNPGNMMGGAGMMPPGGNMMNQGNGNQQVANRPKGGGGYRGNPKLKEIADGLANNRYMGVDGATGTGGKASPLDPRIKEKIAQNKANALANGANPESINAAFQSGLRRGQGQPGAMVLPASFFPDIDGTYDYLKSGNDYLNENGL